MSEGPRKLCENPHCRRPAIPRERFCHWCRDDHLQRLRDAGKLPKRTEGPVGRIRCRDAAQDPDCAAPRIGRGKQRRR